MVGVNIIIIAANFARLNNKRAVSLRPCYGVMRRPCFWVIVSLIFGVSLYAFLNFGVKIVASFIVFTRGVTFPSVSAHVFFSAFFTLI